MTCREAIDLVEAIAAGDMALDAASREHFESCPRCAGALATARRIEAALAGQDTPVAPAEFTPLLMARIRRERWRSEQAVDRLFNAAIAAAVVLMIGGVLALMNLDAVMAVSARVWKLLSTTSSGARSSGPPLSTYVGAIGLFISALAMWWWAERRLSL
jgi:anti-sigma factor RsiW